MILQARREKKLLAIPVKSVKVSWWCLDGAGVGGNTQLEITGASLGATCLFTSLEESDNPVSAENVIYEAFAFQRIDP